MDCPKCRIQVPADDVNLVNLVAKCRRCNEVFAFGGQKVTALNGGLPLAAPRPDGLQVEDEGDRRRITRRWFTPLYLALAVFCIAWNSFLVFWYSMAFSGNGPWIMFVFPLAHVAVGVALTYNTLAGLCNTTVVEVRGGLLQIHHGPLPWWGSYDLETTAIRQLYCDENHNWSQCRSSRTNQLTYNVNAVLIDGSRLKLLSGLDDKGQALFYERQLEEWLDIEPQPVRGEVQ